MKKENKQSKSGKLDKSKIKCYNSDKIGHFTTKWKKAKSVKCSSKVVITKKKDWMINSGSDKQVNYTLVENIKIDVTTTQKVYNVVYDFDINNILELKYF